MQNGSNLTVISRFWSINGQTLLGGKCVHAYSSAHLNFIGRKGTLPTQQQKKPKLKLDKCWTFTQILQLMSQRYQLFPEWKAIMKNSPEPFDHSQSKPWWRIPKHCNPAHLIILVKILPKHLIFNILIQTINCSTAGQLHGDYQLVLLVRSSWPTAMTRGLFFPRG